MKQTKYIFPLLFLLFISSCITQFIPETDEDKDLLVVEGLITDQPGVNTVKLSKSLPLGGKAALKPLKGCIVTLSDNIGNSFKFKETVTGTYVTDASQFRGRVGLLYTLHVTTASGTTYHNFESYPMEMKPVPAIDSIFYKKITLRDQFANYSEAEGCQIYLNTYDPLNQCNFYRWEYSETWEFRLPYFVPNNRCWISANSGEINVKSTVALSEDRIVSYPLKYISNSTDRLKVKYSILVNQYSLNEPEFDYWEKLKNIGEQVGGLYDMIPAEVPSNLICLDNPDEKVLGFFSVSALSSKRIFIEENFRGIINLYSDCVSDTVRGNGPIQYLNSSLWVIEDHSGEPGPWRVLTDKKGCADCTVRGTTTEPLFWKNGK
jgi:hypothetical protein